jgi:hypothetical protein
MTNNTICIPNSSKFQKPVYQAVMMEIGAASTQK